MIENIDKTNNTGSVPPPSAHRRRVLISAYACEPGKGSEPGVGWNLSKALVQHNDVWVITRANNRETIETEMTKHPVPGLKIIYYDLPKWASWWKKGGRGVQLYYFLWQLLAIGPAISLLKETNIDLVHHLTFNQYRTISFGFFLKKPFVMGPVGGGEVIAPSFYRDLKMTTRIREVWRNSGIDRFMITILSHMNCKNKIFIFSNSKTMQRVAPYVKRFTSTVIPAIAINPLDFKTEAEFKPEKSDVFELIYAGRPEDWKGLKIFLKALKSVKEQNVGGTKLRVKLIGIRTQSEKLLVNKWVCENNLSDHVTVIDFMPRNSLIEEMRSADLCVYPAFRDSGAMAVLESCAMGCPIIVFDAGGQDAFPEDVIIKIPVDPHNYEENVNQFSKRIIWAMRHRDDIQKIGKRAQEFAFEKMSWDARAKEISRTYENVIGEYSEL